MRQRLMRFGEALENLKVLTAPEPVAQPLRFVVHMRPCRGHNGLTSSIW